MMLYCITHYKWLLHLPFRSNALLKTYLFFYLSRMYSSKKSSTDTKETGAEVQFLNHFHKAFLRPYGKAGDGPTMATIDKRLNNRNCEWLCRPHTAVSELSDSVYENIKIMENSPLLNNDRLQYIMPQVGALCKNLWPFEGDSTDVPSKDEANYIMHSLVEQNDVNQFMDESIPAPWSNGHCLIELHRSEGATLSQTMVHGSYNNEEGKPLCVSEITATQ